MLHARASVWFEQNCFVDESIEHSLRAEDYERAADLIEAVAETVWARNVDTKLRRWLARLPGGVRCCRPQLCIYHAWYLLSAGRQQEAEQAIDAIESALAPSSIKAREETRSLSSQQGELGHTLLLGKMATLQAFAAFYRGDTLGTIQHANQALQDLPAESLSWRSIATHLLGDGYDFSGQMDQAYHARLAAVEASRVSGSTLQILITNLKLAIVLRNQGHLSRATAICERQLEIANDNGMERSVIAGWLLGIWGETLSELNDLSAAIQKAEKGVALTEQGGDVAMLGWSYICLTRVLFSRGDIAAAEAITNRIDNLARDSFVPPWILDAKAAWQARLWLTQGKQERATIWALERGLDANRDAAYLHEMEYIVFARILIADGQVGSAVTLLQGQLANAEAGSRLARAIEIRIILALAFEAGGHRSKAMAALSQALVTAEPGNFMRIFLDEGPPLHALLRAANTIGIAPDYTRRLLAAFSDAETTNEQPAGQPVARAQLAEPLSARELEVLQLIAQGLSNREICERLFLALSTVKGYSQTIYAKLAVRRRTEAVARARELDLL